jgi:hemerythrin-like metal-binding protein
MAKIQWQTMFETGVPAIDMQHRKLVGMINQLEDALTTGNGLVNEEIGSVLIQLVEYTQYHFAEEEHLQKEIGFSEYSQHVESHKQLLAQVKAILVKIKKGGTINVFEMMNFLRDWLVNHIITEDHRIGVEYKHYHARPTEAHTHRG